MAKSRKKPPNSVVLGLEPRASAPAPVAARSARPLPKCPVCRQRPATTEIAIGPVLVRVCDDCGAAAYHGLGLLSALKNFL
jgi:hypothetical protein